MSYSLFLEDQVQECVLHNSEGNCIRKYSLTDMINSKFNTLKQ